jgi:hypothetical protein
VPLCWPAERVILKLGCAPAVSHPHNELATAPHPAEDGVRQA